MENKAFNIIPVILYTLRKESVLNGCVMPMHDGPKTMDGFRGKSIDGKSIPLLLKWRDNI